MGAKTRREERAATARLFDPLTVGGVGTRNRLAVAPMTRVSAGEKGHAAGRMAGYDGTFAEGGFGLVITEGVCPDQLWSQGYLC